MAYRDQREREREREREIQAITSERDTAMTKMIPRTASVTYSLFSGTKNFMVTFS